MNNKKYFFTICIPLLLVSCVPTQDLIYLQNKSKTAPINPIVSKPYRLQTNDVLNISIKATDPKVVAIFSPSSNTSPTASSTPTEQTSYFDGFSINDHGNIRMPIIGNIEALGLTIDELRIKIEKELLDTYFKKEAGIFVNVKLSGLRFTINGEVGMPGTKTLFQDKVNLLEAIANAGDISITGDRKNVSVMRQFPYGTEIHDIDLTDINALQSPYYYLQPNDYIYVKPLKQKTWGTGKTGIESLGTIITLLTLATTTFLIIKK